MRYKQHHKQIYNYYIKMIKSTNQIVILWLHVVGLLSPHITNSITLSCLPILPYISVKYSNSSYKHQFVLLCELNNILK